MKCKFLIKLLILLNCFFILSCNNGKTINPDTQSPSIVITYPINNSTFESGTIINIVAEAEDNEEISKVQFYVDGVNSYEDSSDPYEYSWDTTGLNGIYTIYAKAIDSSENTTISDILNISLTNEGELPYPPSNPNPQSGSTNISIYTNLSWSCSDPNGDPLTYDVYFGISPYPPLVTSGQSETTYDLENLNEGTNYYWKIVAIDDQSNFTTGDVWQFTTSIGGTSTVTDIDGNVYQTIIFGNQEWMAENLKVTHYNNGIEIPNVADSTQWGNLTNGAYCVYNNDVSYADTYGYIYNWYAVATGNIAPEGWHVPTDQEIKELEIYMGMSAAAADSAGYRGTNEGSKLAGLANLWVDGDLVNNVDFGSSGYKIIPGGYRYTSGEFATLGYYGSFWSATPLNASRSWGRELHSISSKVLRYQWLKIHGLYIRCVKD